MRIRGVDVAAMQKARSSEGATESAFDTRLELIRSVRVPGTMNELMQDGQNFARLRSTFRGQEKLVVAERKIDDHTTEGVYLGSDGFYYRYGPGGATAAQSAARAKVQELVRPEFVLDFVRHVISKKMTEPELMDLFHTYLAEQMAEEAKLAGPTTDVVLQRRLEEEAFRSQQPN